MGWDDDVRTSRGNRYRRLVDKLGRIGYGAPILT